jgi:SAM-dependent methyltransferase
MRADYVKFMQKTSQPFLFNPKRQKAIEERAMHIAQHDADFLVKEAALIMAERLDATNRDFDVSVDMFSPFDAMLEHLVSSRKIDEIYQMSSHATGGSQPVKSLIGSREEIALKPGSTNLITSVFGLHWSNDLPGTLAQIKSALVEDGLFLAALPGDRTLMELRDAMLTAESMINGNATLRVDPFGEVRQFGSLLQRAGFALPVVDTELMTVRYSSLSKLIADLRAMGATSSLEQNKQFGPRELFKKTEEIYRERYQDADGKIRATVEFVFLSGWSPHSSQQKPLKRGSATNKLSDFL